ncbi:MAG: 1-deoxy-D-xylulose-5-phosphate synthase [Hydrotalea sp.]|nr:1-deoxy-D-xylulose-5-phosphate synthase [Hydrotalea sp.]
MPADISTNKRNMRLLDNINRPKDFRHFTTKQLKLLATELRTAMVESVAQTGGHLGASLGVVELTIALHYVFDTPKDLLVWDIGHQTYPHKMLTGRKDQMSTLRQEHGLSGFTMISESPFDHFGAGHSSTAISAALGMAVANQKTGRTRDKVIAVIGDGAMSAGLAFEAMNNAGHLKTPMVVILNDNDMSIAPPVGALSDHLSMLMSSKPFLGLRQLTFDAFDFLPKKIKSRLKLTERYVRGLASGDNFFEHLGFYYVGLVDGHNLDHLVAVLKNIKRSKLQMPILLHVMTKKGKGYQPAELAADKFHGVSQFDVASGKSLSAKSTKPTYTSIVGQSLSEIIAADKNVVTITAAMPGGTGLDIVAERFPKNVLDVGIAEQHAVTFAGGMATRGLKPFVAIYSTFLQRAFDQVVHDIAVQNLPVRFILDRAGFVGADGATHHGAFDLAMLLPLPNFIIMAPKDEAELRAMIHFMKDYDQGPIAIRFPRGNGLGVAMPKKPDKITLGKAEIITAAKNRDGKNGGNIVLWALGSMVQKTSEAMEILQKQNASDDLLARLTLVNSRFAKPLDKKMIEQLRADHGVFITLEEGSSGGLSAQMADCLQDLELHDGKKIALYSRHMPDVFIEQATPDRQLTLAHLSPAEIANFISTIYSAMIKK